MASTSLIRGFLSGGRGVDFKTIQHGVLICEGSWRELRIISAYHRPVERWKMISKRKQIKKNHHYVWADYMRRWSSDMNNVWHTTPKRKVVLDNVKSLARENYFYKAHPLSQNQISLIHHMSSASPHELREKHQALLEVFIKIELLEVSALLKGASKSTVADSVNLLMCNQIENMHMVLEKEAKPVLDELCAGNLSVLDDDKSLQKFIYYFAHQLSRTKSFKAPFVRLLQLMGSKMPAFENASKDMEGCWWFLGYMLGMNIAWSLLGTRLTDRHCLLINDTGVGFITSDHPVINVHQSVNDDHISSLGDECADLFYPLSPRVAYMINRSDRFSPGVSEFDGEFVDEMNRKIARQAATYIIGESRDIVLKYKSYVGQRVDLFDKHLMKLYGT